MIDNEMDAILMKGQEIEKELNRGKKMPYLGIIKQISKSKLNKDLNHELQINLFQKELKKWLKENKEECE